MKYRIGHGFDAHKLQKNEKLILGGVIIQSDLGSVGHSDGDVLLHALTDSILGALALGDIGELFPSSNKEFKNTDSKLFLNTAINKMKHKAFRINNVDITIILQKPIINRYIKDIKKNLSQLLLININNISIKATTTDFLGFIGRSEGLAVHAVSLLIKKDRL